MKNPLDATNLFYQEPLPDNLMTEISEPDAINVAFDLKRTTWSMMSRGTQTVAHYNYEELLHCVVAGHGEHFSLVSPYQRRSISAGEELETEING